MREYPVLLSYFYYAQGAAMKIALDTSLRGFRVRVFADSGAFSAHTSGTSIDVHAYIDWCHRWAPRLASYAALDVKGNVVLGLKHLRIMQDAGLAPVPVFHGGEDWGVLRELCADHGYVALGGIVGGGAGGSALYRWLIRCFEIASETSTVLHGFGITKWSALRDFPWMSVDSTSWQKGARFGVCSLFDRRTGLWHEGLAIGNAAKVHRFGKLLRSYGIDPTMLGDRATYHHRQAAALGAISFLYAGDWLKAHRAPVRVVQRARRVQADPASLRGPLIYLSSTQSLLADAGPMALAHFTPTTARAPAAV